MNRILNVHLLPELADPHELAGHTSVVIDVLRASTTITFALVMGAERIIPCLTVPEARQLAFDRPGALLGGERGGEKLPGFDFGNSPAEYSSDRVSGKTIVFTTTNGTKAMTRCMGASRVLIGALVNSAAVGAAVSRDERVDLVCAGTDDQLTAEDALTAGAIVDRMLIGQGAWTLNDAAHLCRSAWLAEVGADGDRQRVTAAFARSLGGRNLVKIGMSADLEIAAELDCFDLVPALDRTTWEIRG